MNQPHKGPVKYVISCAYAVGTRQVAKGAHAFVLNAWEVPRLFVVVFSRSGRYIKRWENIGKLSRFQLVKLSEDSELFEMFKDHGYEAEIELIRHYHKKEVGGS